MDKENFGEELCPNICTNLCKRDYLNSSYIFKISMFSVCFMLYSHRGDVIPCNVYKNNASESAIRHQIGVIIVKK